MLHINGTESDKYRVQAYGIIVFCFQDKIEGDDYNIAPENKDVFSEWDIQKERKKC
jgi:hypothetical protein